jgi:metal-sulfur cluster biosynthetic enzyme
MTVTREHILSALRAVQDPDLKRDIVSLGFVKHLTVEGGRVAFQIELTTPACPVRDQMREQARSAVASLPGVASVEIGMTSQVRSSVALPAGGPALAVKNIILVAEQLSLPFLGEIPLATPIRTVSDAGRPVVLVDPGSPAARAFIHAAEQLAAQVSIRALQGELAPKVTF